MDRYPAMQRYAQHIIDAQAALDLLNKDYWQQTIEERTRRDMEKAGAFGKRSYASGALNVLIDQHIDDAGYIHWGDVLSESEVVDAVRRAAADDPTYWNYIQEGGALKFEAWQRYTAERMVICAKPDEDMTAADRTRLRDLNAWLIELDD